MPFRAYPSPAYSHIPYRRCPICGKMVKNFEAHTKQEEHEKLKEVYQEEKRKLVKEYSEKYSGSKLLGNSGFITFINQRAWDLAIERLAGRVK